MELCKVIVGDLRLFLHIHNAFLLNILFFSGGLGFFCLHGFHLLLDLLHVHTGEQDLRLLRYLISIGIQSELVHGLQSPLFCIELGQDLFRRLRHKGGQERRADGDGLSQVVKHRSQTVLLLLILCQSPRSGLVDIFIAAAEDIEDLCDGIGHAQLLHLLVCLLHSL